MQRTITIVEDEPLIADDISLMVVKMGHVVGDIFDNAEDTLSYLQQAKPDLLLLDINIEGEKDGIELAQRVQKSFQVPFVFLTSYYDSNTLERAISTQPLGYILKPFDSQDIAVNIELALAKTTSRRKPFSSEKFFIKQNLGLEAVDQSDIWYVEAYDNYANIYTKNKKYLISHTLKSVEQKLDPERFVRIHKSYLVQFDRITSISEGYVYLGSFRVSIGKSYKQALFSKLSFL